MTNLIPFETRFEDIRANVVDIADFNERVIGAYNSGNAEKGLAGRRSGRSQHHSRPAPARCAISATSRRKSRSTSPRTASAAWTASPSARTPPSSARWPSPQTLEEQLGQHHRRRAARSRWPSSGSNTNKYYDVLEKKGVGGGKFGIFIDPTKCKGCAECVDACGDHDALKMIRKNDENLDWYRQAFTLLPRRCRKRRRSSSTTRRSPT